MFKPYLIALMIVSAANVEDANVFMEKLKEHSKQMMPIQFDVECTTISKPRFKNKEEAEKYATDRINSNLGRSNTRPSESEIKAIIDKNVSSFVNGVTGTTYYKCKSYDFHNLLLIGINGDTNNCQQVILFDDEFYCDYNPEMNNMAILPPTQHTRERLYLFEHERAYNFIDNGLKVEEKGDDLYLYISMHGKENYLMKFKKNNSVFPFEIIYKHDNGHSNIYYSNYTEINGIQFPTQIKFDEYQYHEVTNELYLKYVMIYIFSNIKVDKTIKKDDIDIMAPPDTFVNDLLKKENYQLSSSEKPVSVRKNIKR